MEKLKKAYEKCKPALNILFLAVPFIVMDVYIRIVAAKVNYTQWRMYAPSFLFSIIWIGLLSTIPIYLKKIAGRIVYGITFLLFFALFITNIIYFSYTEFFFSFRLLGLAKEGGSYIWNTVAHTKPIVFIIAFSVLAYAIFAIVKFPAKEYFGWRRAIIVLASFIVLHTFIPTLYGRAYDTLRWDAWRNPRNVYNSFTDANKNIKLCGLYEYSFRDFCKTYLAPKPQKTEEEEQVLEEAYKEITPHASNPYTGMFAGKNVIFLQLEGMDTWLLTPEDTPNLYSLLDNSIVYTQHYSYYSGGGSTFNSELAVNTGFITPVTYTQNAYTFTTNLYPQSLPNLFKDLGYRTSVFHMNTGEYYARSLNYINWGYDRYYGLLDIQSYDDASYQLDRELISNPTFYEAMFQQEGPFLHYLITYTPHTPFAESDEKCQLLLQEKAELEALADQEADTDTNEVEDNTEVSVDEPTEKPADGSDDATTENPDDSTGEPEETVWNEEDYARLCAAETDKMIGMLLQALKDNGLYENTVIVAYADHYLYTLNDKTILDQYKQTENNLINNTPFFIWSHDLEATQVDKVNSQLDILPTVLNMFGLEYSEEYFIGHDIMTESYSGYAFFIDRSWYDGNVYVENGEVVLGEAPETEYLVEMEKTVNEKILKNDLTLKYDHFRELETQQTQQPQQTETVTE